MKSCLAVFILANALLLTGHVFAQKLPDYKSVFINDFAEILDPQTHDSIEKVLREAKETRDLELTLVTINSRKDYGFDGAIEPFATDLFNYWGIGNAERNDGIMVLVAVEDRDMRIELGEGYTETFDYVALEIIDDIFIPQFKRGNYALGIELGVDAILRKIDIAADPALQEFSGSVERFSNSSSAKNDTDNFVAWVLGILASIGAAFGGLKFNRHRTRRCELCGNDMRRLNEHDDDAYLNRGQIVEESVRSKDYDVWFCDRDDHTLIKGYQKLFSGHRLCKHCRFKTLHSQRTVMRHATTSREGKARIDYRCKHCKRKWSEIVTIPRESEPSSSSSSSSFGGGSSSGGGASGSW